MHRHFIPVLPPVRYDAVVSYLTRSFDECLFLVDNKTIWRRLKFGAHDVIFSVSEAEDGVALTWWGNLKFAEMVEEYVVEWLGLADDLEPFLQAMRQDAVMGPITAKYSGLRLVGIPDLFEALAWAILGQQIQLSYAYTLKRRVTEKYGRLHIIEGKALWQFPASAVLAAITPDELRALGRSRAKAEYLVSTASMVANGRIENERLGELPDAEIIRQLVAIRGVGPWTAQYVLMRCFKRACAVPIDDVGILNALQYHLCLNDKPRRLIAERVFENWHGFEAYAAFYLWHDLSERSTKVKG